MMEVAAGAEARARGHKDTEPAPDSAAGDARRGPPLSGTSYWLDLWLFLLFDAVLFVLFYLLP